MRDESPLIAPDLPVPPPPKGALRDAAGRFVQLGAHPASADAYHTSPIDLLRWMIFGKKAKWPAHRPLPNGPDTPPERVTGDAMRVCWVGHATCLVQMAGLNLLTDPVFSPRVSPVSFAGPKRVTPPGIAPASLPPIDAILLSHSHYDHCDIPALKWICESHAPIIYCPLGLGGLLRKHHVAARQIVELDWQQSHPHADGITVHLLPAAHWSSRAGFGDRNKTLWGAFAVAHAQAGNLYFAGDTGFNYHFNWAGTHPGQYRLALLPIGAYAPRWFMHAHHMDAREAVEAFARLGARHALAIHHATFQLTDEGIDDPADQLAETLARKGMLPELFRTLPHGGAWEIPR